MNVQNIGKAALRAVKPARAAKGSRAPEGKTAVPFSKVVAQGRPLAEEEGARPAARTPEGLAARTPEGPAKRASARPELPPPKEDNPPSAATQENAAWLPPPPPQFQQPYQAPEVQAARPVLDVRVVQALVAEIVVASKPDGREEVRIQMNSKTLDGLQIAIARKQDEISVQFYSQSPQVVELLNSNMSTLSNALGSHGLNVSSIQVTSPDQSERRERWQERRGGGDQRQQRRQR